MINSSITQLNTKINAQLLDLETKIRPINGMSSRIIPLNRTSRQISQSQSFRMHSLQNNNIGMNSSQQSFRLNNNIGMNSSQSFRFGTPNKRIILDESFHSNNNSQLIVQNPYQLRQYQQQQQQQIHQSPNPIFQRGMLSSIVRTHHSSSSLGRSSVYFRQNPPMSYLIPSPRQTQMTVIRSRSLCQQPMFMRPQQQQQQQQQVRLSSISRQIEQPLIQQLITQNFPHQSNNIPHLIQQRPSVYKIIRKTPPEEKRTVFTHHINTNSFGFTPQDIIPQDQLAQIKVLPTTNTPLLQPRRSRLLVHKQAQQQSFKVIDPVSIVNEPGEVIKKSLRNSVGKDKDNVEASVSQIIQIEGYNSPISIPEAQEWRIILEPTSDNIEIQDNQQPDDLSPPRNSSLSRTSSPAKFYNVPLPQQLPQILGTIQQEEDEIDEEIKYFEAKLNINHNKCKQELIRKKQNSTAYSTMVKPTRKTKIVFADLRKNRAQRNDQKNISPDFKIIKHQKKCIQSINKVF